ncbi:IS66 family insertion sequence element accessory protein TnpA [Aquiflexum sp.]|uniref:IS66 family insertion sequence element accessory protein TnpA n=1 Tax=Aquiflexum sp. TaxID=1872584 RepID=UPI003594317C
MKKINNDEYYDLVCRWQVSGKSKAAFAEEEGISRTAFYYWCKKFSVKQSSTTHQSSFSLVSPHIGFQLDPVIKINFPSGISIEFFGKVDSDTVKKLL